MVQIQGQALGKEGCVLGCILQQQVGHDDVCCHLVQMACAQVKHLLVLGFLDCCSSCIELGCHCLDAVQIGRICKCFCFLFVVCYDACIHAIGYIADCCYGLQLGCSLVYAGDAGIAVDALTGIFEHEAAAAVYLDAVVCILVAVFAVHALGKRGEGVGELLVFLQFLTLLGSKLAFACNILQGLVDIHIACCLV